MGNEHTQELDKMSAHECGVLGQQLLHAGNWDEAERCFFAILEKGEHTGDLDQQCKAAGALGRLCKLRGHFEQARTLMQQSLGLAERLGDRWMQGVNYSEIGETYRMQGQYPQAAEHYRKAIQIH
jgi:tetratricopeptide (TPR) repeat protein